MGMIDWNVALDAVNADQALLLDVVAILQQELPELHNALRQAAEKQDSRELQQAAHKLKGSVRFLGPNDVHTIAETIELTCTSTDESGSTPDSRIGGLCSQLSNAIDALCQELDAYVVSTSQPKK